MPNPANELSVAVSEGAVTVGQHTFRLSGADARRRISTVRDLLAFLEQQVCGHDRCASSSHSPSRWRSQTNA